ncbi:RpiB/LacA/LacB family sugar-phosphate isomerase [uncultured Chloroflexus sp.]|uniref:RpiB/LacA/LacB family sugar-phosphate isomerase n=1 Tax=uncultured Chloroflexus sp. TaxID=214040 RepID=UPI00260FE40F|nr:RpiB/LacA/LacB family sugar-phosphate isomerase [uncultured Chloroflexus sp.]
MRIAVGSDEKNYLTDALIADLERRGHEVLLFGPLIGTDDQWPDVGRAVGEAVASGQADQGIVCCYTGTGVSIAANKVPGIRAALCHDAQTAAGARKWNDANVLALSLRLTTPELVREILDAWFATECPSEEQATIDRLRAFERGGMRVQSA